jgi:hypothetical protein
MSGPCISILAPNHLSNSDKKAIWNYLNSISNGVEGEDFWISGQPFVVIFEEADEEEKVLELNGWNPKSSISYCAICNNQTSHVLLATLAIKTAELIKGMIVLEGITRLTKSLVVLTLSGHIKINDEDYIVEPGFLCYWVGEPDFRLLK